MLVPIVMTGFFLSFVFVPIGNMATVTLSNEQMGNATGIFNLLRNIGGSIGISLASTMLVRRMAFHQAGIAASAPLTGVWFQHYSRQMAGHFAQHLGPAQGQAGALAAMYMQLERQALLWSFVDVFRWTALVAFGAGLVVWLLRRITHGDDGSVKVH
jgi:DHA2 family multidrug resistance protein